MSARRALWFALAVFVIGAIVVAATQGGELTNKERAAALGDQIQCPECDGVSVAESQAPTSRAIRKDLFARVKAGQSDDEIRDAYADRYGESILLDPEGSGLGILVWGLPVMLLIAGAAGLVLATQRWRHQPRLHATSADEELVDSARKSNES